MTIATLARYTMAPGRRAAVLTALQPALDATAAEPGCRYVHVFEDEADPAVLVLVEGWVDAAALARHRTTPHFLDVLMGQVVPLLSGREVLRLTTTFERITTPEGTPA